MIRLLIIADDFTGALDTGVQFAAQGAATRVLTDPGADLRIAGDAQVLVLDAGTRHLPPEQAYDVVRRAAEQAAALGVPYILKKTDSALRGNIGAELAAVLDAVGGGQLSFLPAFPKMGRVTRGGRHYIGGVPVHESAFGKDPFNPVPVSGVTELIALQTDTLAVSCAKPGGETVGGIVVYDAQTQEEMREAARALHEQGRLRAMAGCAGLGAELPQLLGLSAAQKPELPALQGHLLVLCGSVNPVTVAQLDHAAAEGFVRIRLTPEQKLTPGYFDTRAGRQMLDALAQALETAPRMIIDTNDAGGNGPTAAYAAQLGMDTEAVRVAIAGAMARVMQRLFGCASLGTLMITGGDTLLECMHAVGVHEMEPVGELYPGVVLSRFTADGNARMVISKSGGFGGESLLCDLAQRMKSSRTESKDEK